MKCTKCGWRFRKSNKEDKLCPVCYDKARKALIQDALEAQDMYELDDLEAFANKQREQEN